MTNLSFNPEAKDFYKSKACVAISKRYNYVGSCRSYRFKYLLFRNSSSSYRAAFSYVLGHLDLLIHYNLGEVRYNLVSSQFETKYAIRYAASKYFQILLLSILRVILYLRIA